MQEVAERRSGFWVVVIITAGILLEFSRKAV
jgi:hypothetical protein